MAWSNRNKHLYEFVIYKDIVERLKKHRLPQEVYDAFFAKELLFISKPEL